MEKSMIVEKKYMSQKIIYDKTKRMQGILTHILREVC
jgi:hypothetical protein